MKHADEKELQTLDARFKTVGLNASEHKRRDFLCITKKAELDALGSKLSRWGERNSTRG